MKQVQKSWDALPSTSDIQKTMEGLKKNNIEAELVQNEEEAKKRILALIPQGSEVMTMTSVTLDALGIPKELNESGKYNSIRKKLMSMDRKTQGREMQKLGAAPDYAIGSVHAITHDGQILIASNTGSQLPAYASGSAHVIFVVGAQKIVENHEDGMKRLYEHSLPLESERAKKAYGVPSSFISKILTINREVQPGRVHVIFINKVLGF